jgi:hypothetical protein
LDLIIKEHDIAAASGINRGAIGIPEDQGASLRVKYASGEVIYAEDNRGDVLYGGDTLALYKFFLALAREENEDFIVEDEVFWEPHNVLKGRFEDRDGSKALEFESYAISIYEDGNLVEKSSYFIYPNKITSSKVGRSDESFKDYLYFSWNGEYLYGETKEGEGVKFFSIENQVEQK